ncbi:MAG: polysaccharide pyruvyl transferase CsaB [Kaiparowitsia implicata GSE-PSE-MK54-09C]|nr:polysaccharide pyruvyl transferase CsaB [Kaiparowitsia implicata GSE-PSE-MK54-09C]
MRAVLCGYYGMGNGGDEALLATLLQMLPPQVTPLVLSGNPVQTQQEYGVEACNRRSLFAVVQAMRRSDAFIWGGGSLIQDATSAISPLYYGGLMELAQRLGLITLAWAQGVGPLNRRLTRWLARRNFTGCSAVSVRDRASAELLAAWQVPLSLAPDPVWALRGEPLPGLWDLPAPRVAVVLRPHPLFTPDLLARLTKALMDFQQATQTFILLMPFHPEQDGAIAQSIHQHMPAVSQVLRVHHPQQLKGVFQGVEMAIAMRLHGLIMAAAAECRCFALSYDPKVSQLMESLDIPGWSLNDVPASASDISKTWIDEYANGIPLSTDQIQFHLDRADVHRELLQRTLCPLW